MDIRPLPIREVKPLILHDSHETHYLIAQSCVQTLTGQTGFVVYLAKDYESWNFWDARPLIDAILFDTPRQALEGGEEVIRATHIHLERVGCQSF